jgi:transcriptional regulator with XRE-family HTH domain
VGQLTDIKPIIARNITQYRKGLGLTQAELAEKLNYSDKAVSKWERGDSVPDVLVLKRLAEIFGVSLNVLTEEPESKIFPRLPHRKILIPLMGASCVWLAATVAFVLLGIFRVQWETWLCFVFAVPASVLVLTVFNGLWGKRLFACIAYSVLIWTSAVCIYLPLRLAGDTPMQLIFFIPIPMQILIVLWYFVRFKRHR